MMTSVNDETHVYCDVTCPNSVNIMHCECTCDFTDKTEVEGSHAPQGPPYLYEGWYRVSPFSPELGR